MAEQTPPPLDPARAQRAIIDELALRGTALLVISSEMPEVLGLADRIVVMRGGRVAGTLDRSDASEERVLSLAILEDAA